MPTKCGFYSDNILNTKFPQKAIEKQVAREQYPSAPWRGDDQTTLNSAVPKYARSKSSR